MKIDRSRLADEALRLLGSGGLAGLNMRALADRLGIGVSALYWHVRNKEDLVGLVAAGIYERAFDAVRESDWRQWLRAFGHALRRELLTHRDASQICAIMAPPQAFEVANLHRLVGPLALVGLPADTGLSYQSSVISLTVGWALFEQREVTRTFLSRALDFTDSFTTGLDALVAGFPEPAAINGDRG